MIAGRVRREEEGLCCLVAVLCNLLRSSLSLPRSAIIDWHRRYGEQLIPHINQLGNSSRRLLRSGLFVLNGVLNANAKAAQQKLITMLKDPHPRFPSDYCLHWCLNVKKKMQRSRVFSPRLSLSVVLSINMYHREVFIWYCVKYLHQPLQKQRGSWWSFKIFLPQLYPQTSAPAQKQRRSWTHSVY